jgi:hypothetical protein
LTFQGHRAWFADSGEGGPSWALTQGDPAGKTGDRSCLNSERFDGGRATVLNPPPGQGREGRSPAAWRSSRHHELKKAEDK